MGLGDAISSVMQVQTDHFIKYRPENVTLVRSTKVSDGMGGSTVSTSSPLAPQLMRLVPAKTVTDQAPVRVTVDGQQVHPSWYLVAMHDADVRIGDKTTVRNHKLEIVFVSDLPEERIVAECWEKI